MREAHATYPLRKAVRTRDGHAGTATVGPAHSWWTEDGHTQLGGDLGWRWVPSRDVSCSSVCPLVRSKGRASDRGPTAGHIVNSQRIVQQWGTSSIHIQNEETRQLAVIDKSLSTCLPLGACCAPVVSWTPPPLVQCSLDIRHVSMCPTRASSATLCSPKLRMPALGLAR